MALSSKISTIYIQNEGGTWSYSFTTNNFVSDLGQVNFTEAYDEAIDGSLRSNFRGYRAKISLNWQKLHDSTVNDVSEAGSLASTVGLFLDDLRTTFAVDGDNAVRISFSGEGSANHIDVIPENLNYKTTYTNQIGRASASLDFIGQQILTSIPSYLEAPSV